MPTARALSSMDEKKQCASGVRPDTQTGDTETLNVGSRLPYNAENFTQGQDWGNWHDAGMKKWREGSNFHKASPGNMQMASRTDFALDENVMEASQWPLTLRRRGPIGNPPREGDRGRAPPWVRGRKARECKCILYFTYGTVPEQLSCSDFLRGSKSHYFRSLLSWSLGPQLEWGDMPVEIHRNVPYGLWNGVPCMGYPYFQREAMQSPLLYCSHGPSGAPCGGPVGFWGGIQWVVMEAVFETSRKLEAEMGESYERKTHSAGSKENYYSLLFNWFIWNALRSHRKLLLLNNW